MVVATARAVPEHHARPARRDGQADPLVDFRRVSRRSCVPAKQTASCSAVRLVGIVFIRFLLLDPGANMRSLNAPFSTHIGGHLLLGCEVHGNLDVPECANSGYLFRACRPKEYNYFGFKKHLFSI